MTVPLAKLLKRDPRMVERKKTGKAKARKGVSALSKAAVLFTYPIFSLSSTLGSSVKLLSLWNIKCPILCLYSFNIIKV